MRQRQRWVQSTVCCVHSKLSERHSSSPLFAALCQTSRDSHERALTRPRYTYVKGNTDQQGLHSSLAKDPAQTSIWVCLSVRVCVHGVISKAPHTQKTEKKTKKNQTSTQQHNSISHNGFWVWEIRKYNDAHSTQWPYKLLICVWKYTSFLSFLPSLCQEDTLWHIMCSCHLLSK